MDSTKDLLSYYFAKILQLGALFKSQQVFEGLGAWALFKLHQVFERLSYKKLFLDNSCEANALTNMKLSLH